MAEEKPVQPLSESQLRDIAINAEIRTLNAANDAVKAKDAGVVNNLITRVSDTHRAPTTPPPKKQ